MLWSPRGLIVIPNTGTLSSPCVMMFQTLRYFWRRHIGSWRERQSVVESAVHYVNREVSITSEVGLLIMVFPVLISLNSKIQDSSPNLIHFCKFVCYGQKREDERIVWSVQMHHTTKKVLSRTRRIKYWSSLNVQDPRLQECNNSPSSFFSTRKWKEGSRTWTEKFILSNVFVISLRKQSLNMFLTLQLNNKIFTIIVQQKSSSKKMKNHSKILSKCYHMSIHVYFHYFLQPTKF